jgi:hypothetical protein
MTRRAFRAWCYLGTRCGPIEDLAQDALDQPETDFVFAADCDKARIRRAIEDAIRKTATDRQLVEIARMLNLI